MSRNTHDRDAPPGVRRVGTRRLIAGLRITARDEALLDVVRPFLPEADSASACAYRLWRRGLEVTLAEVAGLGVALPPGTTEELVARLVAQRLQLCLPLLRRTGTLALLGIAATYRAADAQPEVAPAPTVLLVEPIDPSAADAISGLGGGDFL